MLIQTIINNRRVGVEEALVKKYDVPAPRYTSYPTAPVWTSEFGAGEYSVILSELTGAKDPKNESASGGSFGLCPQDDKHEAHLSLYLHIPFCEHRCAFCGCSTIATPHHEVADRYIEALGRELKLVAGHVGRMSVSQIHLGGGNPTYLEPRQLEKLWGYIQKECVVARNAEISVEADPRVTTDEHLKCLSGLGFNRISLGVQDTNARVQKAIGREEDVSHLRAVVRAARRAGFKGVNIDLIYGLPFQTLSSFGETVRDVIGFEADRVACFNFAYLPVQLKHQAAIDPAALPAGVKKIELFCLACERFDSAGMRLVGMDHFAKEGDELSVAAREGTLWRNFQGYTTRRGVELVGLGMTAISDLGGCYAQNAKKLADYYRAVENSRFATARGWRLSEEDLRRREMIRELFCNGETKKPMSDVGCRMSELQCDGLIEIKSDKLTVTPLGRLFIRNIAMMFDEYLGTARTQFSKAV